MDHVSAINQYYNLERLRSVAILGDRMLETEKSQGRFFQSTALSKRGAMGEEELFHNNIIGNFMVYQ